MKKLFGILFIAILLAGCQSKEEKFLQGEWESEDGSKVVFDGNKSYAIIDGNTEEKKKFKVREDTNEDVIIVEESGFPNDLKFVSRYEVVEGNDNEMYYSDYWSENSEGEKLQEGDVEEDFKRVEDSSGGGLGIVFTVVIIIGLVWLYRRNNNK